MDLNPTSNEVRDPVHGFIYYDDFEEAVINSAAVQRLKFIRQLGMTYQVYPGATHTRFEHSLGTMWLAGRIFDVITDSHNLRDEVSDLLPELRDDKAHWRRVVRLAGLLHDLGHLPFSHAAEEDLGCKHEEITKDLIMQGEIADKLGDGELKISPLHVAKIALGRKDFPKSEEEFSSLENTLAEIISGDVFGADRMDYLLRDSLYTGVVTGHIDHLRLIDTIRILLPQLTGPGDSISHSTGEPCLGINKGGLHTAEALLLSRYFMFAQVYYHPVRRIYDIHLGQFMNKWLKDGKYPTDLQGHLSMNDNRILEAIREASRDRSRPDYEAAHRIQARDHFKTVYSLSATDAGGKSNIIEELALQIEKEFDKNEFVVDWVPPKDKAKRDFPVELQDRRVVSAFYESSILEHVPVPIPGFIFGKPENVARMKELCNNYLQYLGERHEPV